MSHGRLATLRRAVPDDRAATAQVFGAQPTPPSGVQSATGPQAETDLLFPSDATPFSFSVVGLYAAPPGGLWVLDQFTPRLLFFPIP